MKVTKETVQKTAHLARLNVDPSQEERMIHDLQKMVDWVDKLKEVDTTEVEPIHSMSSEVNAFREDAIGPHIATKDAFKNAPRHDESFFKVPKVIK